MIRVKLAGIVWWRCWQPWLMYQLSLCHMNQWPWHTESCTQNTMFAAVKNDLGILMQLATFSTSVAEWQQRDFCRMDRMFPTPPDSCEDSFILFLSGDIFNGSSLLVVCYPTIPADFPSLFINTRTVLVRKAQDCTHPKNSTPLWYKIQVLRVHFGRLQLVTPATTVSGAIVLF